MGPPSDNSTPSQNSIKNDGFVEDNQRRTGNTEKTSLELLLESTERAPGHRNFDLLRDSILFNQERIRHQQGEPNGLLPSDPPSSRFAPLHPINSNIQVSSRLLMTEDELEIAPKSYPVSDRTAQNRANANLDRHVGWQLPPAQFQQPQIVRSRHNVRSMPVAGDQMDTSGDIPLATTQASLNLPSPPLTNLSYVQTTPIPPNNNSATTVTTVYAYKCNRVSKHIGTEDNSTGNDGRTNTSDPDYEIRTQEVPYPYPVGQQFHPVVRESEELLFQNSGDVCLMREDTRLNSTNIQSDPVYSPPGDHATDDELDDDLYSYSTGQPVPVFPNPAELKWPDFSTLHVTLDSKFHQHLEPQCVKDCRTWLWKGERGRRARELLAVGRTLSKSAVGGYQRVNITSDVHTTIKAFSDNDDAEDEEEAVLSVPR